MTTAEVTSPRPLACSRLSLEADEDLHGTASTVTGYLVLEHGGPWGTKVLRDAPFSDPDGTAVPLGARLSTVLGPLGVTTLLVRRPGARHGIPRRPTVMLVALDGTAAHGARTTVGAVSRLFGWKLPALLDTLRSGVVPDGWEPLETQYLVCTHARRDACCGELGRPLVTALAALEPARTWEVSHVGGHRFAPNTLVLPEGLVYGRLPATRGRELVDAHAGGRLLPDALRGRAGLAPAAQAAEVAVRRAAGEDRAATVTLVDAAEDGTRTSTRWSVGGRAWRAEVETVPGRGAHRPSSCGKEPEAPSPRHVVREVAPE
ncbi:sucrase ferredoxin [Georgenia sp. EYE_87]|uniref:sucrase ferredoxin n=1 Tax=Georgenia sp. EYE_87 TaxID=2853448 RepID=UPI002004BE5E|nr:sucrase ferredoxin [Georgenia sp. EYE_87]MCK6209110.1 sucrase ferredoxin [Georgenia sp. EYE_87]